MEAPGMWGAVVKDGDEGFVNVPLVGFNVVRGPLLARPLLEKGSEKEVERDYDNGS
uniref:Uncharacterized protein n=1 Tax=Oryza glumipatula TaxID=40148 RepID=A0A0E0BJR5_9ORYZ